MKIRSGFVSNSSSSSFILLLPKNFDVETQDYSSFENPIKAKNCLKKLIKDNQLWQDGNYDVYHDLTTFLKDYIITSIDTGPDEGTINLLNNRDVEKIKRILSL
jgi:hypothetical protein